MQKTKKFILSLLLLLFPAYSFSIDSQQLVRARIGIEIRSGEETRSAKLRDRIAAGDRFRVYVISEPDPGYAYVIYADKESVSLLNNSEQRRIPKDTVLELPASDKSFQVDEQSASFTITAICSPTPLSELESLWEAETYPLAQWKKIEQNLTAQNEIDLSSVPQTPWILAGTTRDVSLNISSGNSLVVKRYEFRVKK